MRTKFHYIYSGVIAARVGDNMELEAGLAISCASASEYFTMNGELSCSPNCRMIVSC